MKTVRIELINNKSLQLLRDLESMGIIRLLQPEDNSKKSLSEKYRGILSKQEGQDLNRHIARMRGEWNQ